MAKNTRRALKEFDYSFQTEFEEIEWNGMWIPKTVYKYRDWQNKYHKPIIVDQELWIPSPHKFNDPFDCNIPIAFNQLLDNNEMAHTYFLNMVNSDHSLNDVQKEAKIQELMERLKDDKVVSNIMNAELDSLRNQMGVYSVTAVNDNMLMWAHYGASHTGFCVGLDSTRLFEHFGGGTEVVYEQDFPIINPLDEPLMKMHQQVNSKAKVWGYEMEYRLTKFKETNISLKISPDIITELILGANISNDVEDDLLENVAIHLPKISLFRIRPDEHSFLLHVDPIT